jgi:DinB superfamily
MNDAPTPLTPAAVGPFLRATLATLTAEIDALSAEALAWHPAPGEWCVKEVLGHLIETERRGFAGRIRIILAGQEPRLEGWDQNGVAAARRDCERDARELLGELATMRQDSVRLVEELKAADLARGGGHPTVGRLTVADLLNEWIHHDRNHVRQVLANVQAYVWPHMGNAQKFSAP